MAHTIAGAPGLARVGLMRVVDQFAESWTTQYTNILGTEVSSKQDFERMIGFSDFGSPVVTNEGSAVAFDSLAAPFQMDVKPQMRTLGFEITMQAEYTDLYKKVSKPEIGRALGLAFMHAREQSAANLLNLGFSTPAAGGTTTLDAAALFSPVHPLETGTATNMPGSSLPLSASGLEQAVQELNQQKTHKGKVHFYTGTLKLVVPAGLEMLAYRIVNSTLQAGTNTNDKNVLTSRVEVAPNYFLTDTNNWFLMAQGEPNPLCRLKRIPFFVKETFDERNLVHVFVAGEEWKDFANGWRNTWGTNP